VTFTKLFSSITASTVWCRPSDTRVVWITMLAMADRHGRVWASIPGLAKESAVSLDACQTAIDEFLAPDPYSRTKVCEGRRIEPIDGGWRLINHAKYRAIRDEEERRFYKTAKQREYRAVDNVDKSGQVLNGVDAGAHNAEAEAEAEAEAKVQKPSRAKAADLDQGSELMLANWLLEEAGVVADNNTRLIAATAIRLLSREGGTTKDAADYILAAAKEATAAGEVVNRFWFTDQRYRPAVPTKSKKQRDKDARIKAFLEAGSDD
jgi:hypothetical protein